METRRMRKRTRRTPPEIPPEWLPDGWTVEIRNTRHGNYRYYRSQVSGCTFQSKEEVLRHLSVIKHDHGASGRASCSNESKKQLAEEMKESLEWLPSGRISEIKTPRSGKTAGKTCKPSDSVNKRKSQSTGKKHILTEEILNSNGELNEIATIPDRLLQPPSSHENVEVKPEEGNAAESATLNHPCPRNTVERTPKNGRIQAKKSTRKSNISNKKANMESKENIELENVTLRPSDETNNGRESKPESTTKSTANSKEEDEVMPQAEHGTDKFPLVSNETSKDLLEDEMKHIMACQKTSVVKVNFLDPQNNNLPKMEEKEHPAAVGNPSTPDLVKPKSGSRKTKAVNAVYRPQQLSRQLAYIEVDPTKDVDMGGERPHKSKSRKTNVDMLEKPHQRQYEESRAANIAGRLQRQNTMEEGAATAMVTANQLTVDWTDSSSTSPFGDSWPDPCLEFAFKTLTGDLPVLDDAIAIQEYFQQHLFLFEGSTSPDVIAPISNNKANDAPSDEVEIKLPSQQDLQESCQSALMEKK